MMLLFTVIGEAASKNQQSFDYRIVLVAILLGALFINATTVNDIADEKIDKVNLVSDKSRPLVTSQVKKNDLKILSLFSLFLAIIAAFLIKPILILLVIISVIISYTYSMPPAKISYRGFLAPLYLSISYVVIPYIIGISLHTEGINSENMVLLLGLYISFIGRIILKDFRDVKGDKMYGKRTFLVRYGPKITCEAAGIAWIIGDLIISNLYVLTHPLMVILLQPFIISILFTLHRLANEKSLVSQLILVSLIGRLGNSVALSILTVLTLRFYNYSIFWNSTLLIIVFLVGSYTSYYLYALYIQQLNVSKHYEISKS
ncbi:MAG: UbiA prenyltransferase family protein [Bacteroidota bacterium]|nr:UbiA prenyltransferase family protein [Bacteroidota bacterium]